MFYKPLPAIISQKQLTLHTKEASSSRSNPNSILKTKNVKIPKKQKERVKKQAFDTRLWKDRVCENRMRFKKGVVGLIGGGEFKVPGDGGVRSTTARLAGGRDGGVRCIKETRDRVSCIQDKGRVRVPKSKVINGYSIFYGLF